MKTSLKILILNWRDIKNPSGGGAEQLTHEMAKRWVKKGHKVIQICALFPNAKKEEVIDGVYFVRMGRWWTVHIFAALYYFRKLHADTDIIIDEVHWFPFFSIFYAPKKTIAFTCEVANKLLFGIFPYPLALLFRGLEKIYLHLYKNIPTLVISESTEKALVKEEYNPKVITVLPMGLTVPKDIKVLPKEKRPTIISLGRLNKQKGIPDILEAFRLIKEKIPECQFWIAGSGEKEFMDFLNQKVEEYRLRPNIHFFGFVTEKKKNELLARAHILIGASMHEGWGLTVPEAGLVKTPAVVYNVPGFQDIISHKKDGILSNLVPKSLAENIVMLLQNKRLYKMMQEKVYKKSKSYSWENTAEVSLRVITSR